MSRRKCSTSVHTGSCCFFFFLEEPCTAFVQIRSLHPDLLAWVNMSVYFGIKFEPQDCSYFGTEGVVKFQSRFYFYNCFSGQSNFKADFFFNHTKFCSAGNWMNQTKLPNANQCLTHLTNSPSQTSPKAQGYYKSNPSHSFAKRSRAQAPTPPNFLMTNTGRLKGTRTFAC